MYLCVDPFPKPSYLFAVVAGDLGSIHSTYTTTSGRGKIAIFPSIVLISEKCVYNSCAVGHLQRQGERQPAGARHVQSEGEHAVGRRHVWTRVRLGCVQRGCNERLQYGRNVIIHIINSIINTCTYIYPCALLFGHDVVLIYILLLLAVSYGDITTIFLININTYIYTLTGRIKG